MYSLGKQNYLSPEFRIVLFLRYSEDDIHFQYLFSSSKTNYKKRYTISIKLSSGKEVKTFIINLFLLLLNNSK